jgi:hypothetical protein
MPTKLRRWVGIVAVLNLAMIALLSGRPHFSNASRPVRGISKPILALEVVRNVSEVDAILSDAPSPDREVMRIKQYACFAFVGGYTALFVLMGMMLAGKGRVLAISAVSIGLAATLADVIKTFAILRLVDVDLSHTTQAMIDAIRYPSLIKWTCFSVTFGLLGVLMWRTGGKGLRVVGALYMLTALLGLHGVFYDQVSLQRFLYTGSITLVGLAVLYFRPRWPKPGRSA